MELSLLYALQEIHTPVLDAVMVFLSTIGNGGTIWVIAAVLLCCRKKSRPCGIAMLAAMFAGLLIGNGLLKHMVARPRPCWICPQVPMLIPVPHDYSFPSGHTLASFEAAMVLFLYRRRLGVPALLLAGAIGFSRMYLFVHYPTDVLAGMALGILLAVAAAVGMRNIQERCRRRDQERLHNIKKDRDHM